MSNTTALLDKALKLCRPGTKYQLAKRLGIKPGTISRCYLHNGTLDNETAFKLAEMLRMPVPDVIAYMEEDRAKDDKKREFWRRQLPRALPSIAIGTALLLAVKGNLIDGRHGVGIDKTKVHLTLPTYTLCALRRIAALVKGALKSLLTFPPSYAPGPL